MYQFGARHMVDRLAVENALGLTREHLLSRQMADGSWSGLVESDPRVSAFYLNTLWSLGRRHDDRTREIEAYLKSEQLDCGGWAAWPGGGADIDVSAVCLLALRDPATHEGRSAAAAAKAWLAAQSFPAADLFWKGYLAINRELKWDDLPYFTTRLVTHPRWLHPNVYDFSVARVAIVALALIQAHEAQPEVRQSLRGEPRPPGASAGEACFVEWRDRWIANTGRPIRGFVPFLAEVTRWFDSVVPTDRHRAVAIQWLLDRQESDGSFFSSVHITSLAIIALHVLGGGIYRDRIEAGLAAMHKWQVVDDRGRRQQFTDSTTWDTGLCMDLLLRLGVPPGHEKMRRACNYLVACQNRHAGDWSRRTTGVEPGGWSFQRIGKWYPDVDDAALIASSLLEFADRAAEQAARQAIAWIIGMQGADGGWASWDRDDRSWTRFKGAGPWLAGDPACADITARAISLLSKVVGGKRTGYADLIGPARNALARGLRWLQRDQHGNRWLGAWFTHYLYGTSQVAEAYRNAGFDPDHPDLRAAREWIVSVANPDGGFGETPESGRMKRFASGPSTPFHTACALNALVYAGAARSQAARRAARWLLSRQNTDGTWTNDDFFAAGIPGLWYANFTLTPTCLAARSLLAFTEFRTVGGAHEGATGLLRQEEAGS